MATFKPLGARTMGGLFGLWLILLAISVCCTFVECLWFKFTGLCHFHSFFEMPFQQSTNRRIQNR